VPDSTRRRILYAGAALGATAIGLMRPRSARAEAQPTLSGPLAQTGARGVLVWDVAGIGYHAAEYILSGVADVYSPVSMADAPDVASRDSVKDLGARTFPSEVLSADQPFRTRLIVYRPEDARRFSGTVIVETLHPIGGGTSLLWRALHGFFAGRGDAYVGVQHPLTFGGLKAADADRYGVLTAASPTQLWGMLRHAGALLRSGEGGLLPGMSVKRILMTGYSYTGVATATFANYHHASATFNGSNIFDGYLPMADVQYIRPLDVPVIRLNTQSDYNSFGGLANRRTDDALYRHYEVAGASHVTTTPPSDAAKPPADGRIPTPAGQPHFDESQCRAQFPPASRPNDFPLDLVQAAMFDNMDRWLRSGQPPPPSAFIETQRDGTTAVDQWGNALGGVRYPQVSVPIARYGVGPPGPCLLFGFTAPFATDVCKRLYGDHATYVERVTKRTQELVASRLLLVKGAEHLVAVARADATFS
jgi:dienelactone hydrolase